MSNDRPPRWVPRTDERQRKEISIRTLIACLGVGALVTALPATANPTIYFEASPYSFQNSDFNFENSPYNYRNSPYNFNNGAINARSTNGIYNNEGHRIGYEVQSPAGVTNFFGNEGNRIGYQPARSR